MKAKFYANQHSTNPIITILFDDDYYVRSEEFDWIANILGATWIDYD